MYCSNCGTGVTEGLKYCNRCGVNLKPIDDVREITRPAGLGWIVALGFVTLPLLVLGVIFTVLMIAMDLRFPPEYIMALSIISLVLVFGSVAMLTRLLSPAVSAYLHLNEKPKDTKLPSKEYDPPQIEPAREQFAAYQSVVENTTRSFERAPRKEFEEK